MRYLLLLIVLMVAACSDSNITVASPEHREPTRHELRKAMEFHGVLFAQQDNTGEWYFMRDGKRCRLFVSLETARD